MPTYSGNIPAASAFIGATEAAGMDLSGLNQTAQLQGAVASMLTNGVTPVLVPTTASIQRAIDLAGMAGGGVVAITTPGTYDLTYAGLITTLGYAGFPSGARYCVDLGYDNVTLVIGKGVTLRLADSQQVDGHVVEMFVFQDRAGLTITGGGTIDGNAAGQAGWTGDYGGGGLQDGCGIGGLGTASGGNNNIEVSVSNIYGFFGAASDITNNVAAQGSDVRYLGVTARNCGEGLLMSCVNLPRVVGCDYFDTTGVTAADAIELADCTNYLIDQCTVKADTPGDIPGSAFDYGSSQGGTLSNFLVDGTTGFIGNSPGGSGDPMLRNVITNGVIRNLLQVATIGGEGATGAVDGSWNVSNVQNYPSTGVGGFYFIGDAGDGVITLSNVSVIGHTQDAFGCAGSRRVVLNGCPTDGGVGVTDVAITSRANGEAPNVTIIGSRLTGRIVLTAQGRTGFTPTIKIGGGTTAAGIDIETVAQSALITVTGPVFPDATNPTAVVGRERLVYDQTTIASLGQGTLGQQLTIARSTSGTTTISDVSAGGAANCELPGGANFALTLGDRITLEYNPTTLLWYTVAYSTNHA